MYKPGSTIYQNGWLDLVFANRNKAYGAYELRQNYNKRLGRALLISCFFVSMMFIYPIIKELISQPLTTVKVSNPDERVIEDIYIPPLNKPEPKPAETQAAAPVEKTKVKTVRFTPPVVVSGPVVEEPPTTTELQSAAVGAENVEGIEGALVASPAISGDGNGSGMDSQGGNGDAVLTPDLLEKYPEFPGGMDAFANFLRKNLRYPNRAQEEGIGGKVFVSFVVEKDGRLTDIKVLRGIGFGCDEEATRVLKKSPSWNPGIQNNRSVRVLYTLPLVFQMSE